MAIRARTYRDARAQARSNPELAWWVFMRLSGVLLVVLTFFHLFQNYIVTDETSWTYQKTASEYSQVSERLYLLALLALAFLHGGNGLRYGIDDWTSRNPRLRFAVKSVVYTVVVALFVFGAIALFSHPALPGVRS